jgi:hypothetical protein
VDATPFAAATDNAGNEIPLPSAKQSCTTNRIVIQLIG